MVERIQKALACLLEVPREIPFDAMQGSRRIIIEAGRSQVLNLPSGRQVAPQFRRFDCVAEPYEFMITTRKRSAVQKATLGKQRLSGTQFSVQRMLQDGQGAAVLDLGLASHF